MLSSRKQLPLVSDLPGWAFLVVSYGRFKSKMTLCKIMHSQMFIVTFPGPQAVSVF